MARRPTSVRDTYRLQQNEEPIYDMADADRASGMLATLYKAALACRAFASKASVLTGLTIARSGRGLLAVQRRQQQ